MRNDMLQRLSSAVRIGAQCTNYPGDGDRCRNPAAGVLVSPDGQPFPGGVECETCAEHAIDEYWNILGQFWTFVRPD